MYSIIIALALLLYTTTAHAAIGFVGSTQLQGVGPTPTVNTTGATFIGVCVVIFNSAATVTDSNANTYTRVLGPLTINDSTAFFVSTSPIVGPNHTWSLVNGSGTDVIIPAAFSGLPAAILERSNANPQGQVASGATITSGDTSATITPDQLVLGCAQLSTGAAFTWTVTGGAIEAGSIGAANVGAAGAMSYKIVSTTGVQAATFTANTAGQAATVVGTWRAGVVDTQAPPAPNGCNATSPGSFTNVFQCAPVTDNGASGICSYPVRACSTAACTPTTVVASPATPTLTHTGLTASTLYRYTMQAVDCAGNSSPQSSIVETTTLALTECNYSWIAPVGGTAPENYPVYRCDDIAQDCTPSVEIASVNVPTTTYKDTACPQPRACVSVAARANGLPGTLSAPVCVSSPAQTTPVLAVTPTSLVFNALVGGGNPAAKTLTVSNQTQSTMNWTLGDDQAWLSATPSSGTNNTVVTVSVSIAGLTAGTYPASITVTAPGATGSPIVVPVTLNLSPAVTPSTNRGGGRFR